MGWVLVPVPADLEKDVAAFVMRLRYSGAAPMWDTERVDRHLRALGEDARALVVAVARGITRDHAPADTALADAFGVTVREILGLAQEVNDVRLDPSPGALVFVRRERHDDDESDQRVVYMWEPLADLVCEWADDNGMATVAV